MIPVRETAADVFERVKGNPTLDSLDGKTRAPLLTVLHESWSAEDRAAYGVYLVEPFVVPSGKVIVSGPTYARVNGVVTESYVVTDYAPTAEEQRQATFAAQSDRSDLLDRLKSATPQQIDTWIDNNVTNLASARMVLKAIVKLLVAVEVR